MRIRYVPGSLSMCTTFLWLHLTILGHAGRMYGSVISSPHPHPLHISDWKCDGRTPSITHHRVKMRRPDTTRLHCKAECHLLALSIVEKKCSHAHCCPLHLPTGETATVHYLFPQNKRSNNFCIALVSPSRTETKTVHWNLQLEIITLFTH